MQLAFRKFMGTEIPKILQPLAELRIQVFREFPYLYDGSLAYEQEYLKTYIEASDSFLFAVFDEEKLVGATTCIALEQETLEVRKPFLEKKIELSTVCYFGESILLKPYRGLGLGVRFFEEREAYAQEIKRPLAAFCAVQRPAEHPLRPENYKDLSSFWQKRGYQKSTNLVSEFNWKDIDEDEETPKRMEYWTKTL
ncbi:GNAT family N-acetyltransferase [Jiulongibacter sp. NS-SX5]|uniref:GNAT family N-acetyltransferase n=1 Tax=Jiulongibacter sp. NS-SX5 TaxID=3463854 RepID=UPI004059D98B